MIVTGCVTGGGDRADSSGAQLVERSKETPPAWIDLEAGRIHETEALLRYVEIRTKLLDFAKGISDTQVGALKASKLEFKELIRRNIFEYAQSENFPMEGSMSDLDRIVENVSERIYLKHARVADTYFEKYEFDSIPLEGYPDSFFRTHVLVHFPKSRVNEVYSGVAYKLNRSSSTSLRSLGRMLRELGDTGLTH